MNGLKNVSHRHDDALSRVDLAEWEHLLATCYREVGWRVEHAGTGGTGARFDGDVDLRICRDAEVVLVQCKHWNAKQVPHNAVHELLGVMINGSATGAILVSSGEFTRAAARRDSRAGRAADRHRLRTAAGRSRSAGCDAATASHRGGDPGIAAQGGRSHAADRGQYAGDVNDADASRKGMTEVRRSRSHGANRMRKRRSAKSATMGLNPINP